VRGKILQSLDGLCTGCGYCMPCPSGVLILLLMDAYNEKILGGGDPAQITDRLKWHWRLRPEDAQVRTPCGASEDQCIRHPLIQERFQGIAVIDQKRTG
jgi:hypothetical protein